MDDDLSSKTSSEDEQKQSLVSRRSFVGKACGAALAGISILPAWAHGAHYGRGHKKVSKATAHYQYHPHGKQHCSICAHFHGPDSCEIVEGRIAPNGWCRYFEARMGKSNGSRY